MNSREVLKFVDHTLLKPFATWEDIKTLCDEAIEYQTASVCIPPCYVKDVHDTYGSKINICTVIGFPLGYSATQVKLAECCRAIEDGANEIDMVINISDVKNKNYKNVENEIASVREIAENKILKVIVETCYLSEEEKINLCNVVTDAGADYIKTSTGFGTCGATIEDIRLFKQHIGSDVKIKASGGIKTIEQMEAFINEGCLRIGTSSAINAVKNDKLR